MCIMIVFDYDYNAVFYYNCICKWYDLESISNGLILFQVRLVTSQLSDIRQLSSTSDGNR